MGLFRRKKKNAANDRLRSNDQNQRVISYYTASRQQLDNFERKSAQMNDSLAYSRFERIRSNWFTITIVVVVLAAALYLATLSTTPHVVVQGTQYRSPSDYQKLVQASFGHDIRNRLKPFLQSSSLEKSISDTIPEASVVVVNSSFLGHRPEVKIFSDAPLATFTQPGDTSYILSERGRLLLPSSDATVRSAQLPIIQNLTGVEGKAGEQFMRPDEAKAFSSLLSQYKADTSTPIATLTTIPHEITVKEVGRGYYARYLLNETVTSQYGSLRAVENKLRSSGQTPAEYIDVRLVDKVYYK